MAIPEIRIKVGADTTGLDQGMVKVQESVKKFAAVAEATGGGIGDIFGKAGGKVQDTFRSVARDVVSSLAATYGPAALLTAAITGIGAAAYSAFGRLKDETLSTNEIIKRHDALIRALKEAHGEAAKGLDDYMKASQKVYQTEILANQARLLDDLKKKTEEFLDEFTRAPVVIQQYNDAFVDMEFAAKRGFGEFGSALKKLQDDFRSGNVNIVDFRDGVDKIAMQLKAEGSPTAIKYGDAILKASKELYDLYVKAGLAGPAIDLVTGAMQRGQAAASGYASAMKAIEGIAPKQLSSREQVEKAFKEAEFNAQDEEQYRRAVQARNDAMRRIEEEEKARRKPTGGAVDNTDYEAEAERARLQSKLEILRQHLLSKDELMQENFIKNQQLIEEAAGKEVISEQQKLALLEQLNADHYAKLEAMRDAVNMKALQSTADMFGSLQQATESFGKKDSAMAKAFGIAQALINTYVGATKALASAPFPANMAAFAAVMAKGLAAVAAITAVNTSGKGGNAPRSIGGGTSSGGQQQQQPEQAGRSMYVSITGSTFSREQMREFMEQANSFFKDGGGQMVFQR